MWLRKLLRDDRGTPVIEMAIVLPLLMLLILGMTEFAMLFFAQNTMWNVAREAARRMAVADMTATEAQTFVQNMLPGHLTYNVNAQEPDPNNPADEDVVVTIDAAMRDASIINYLNLIPDNTFGARVTMRREQGG